MTTSKNLAAQALGKLGGSVSSPAKKEAAKARAAKKAAELAALKAENEELKKLLNSK